MSCPILAIPWTVCSLPGSSVHGIIPARILEWVAISYSRFYTQQCTYVSPNHPILPTLSLSHPLVAIHLFFMSVSLFLFCKQVHLYHFSKSTYKVLGTAPPSMEFSRQEYWSGLPFPSPGDIPDLGIKPRSPALQADSLPFEPPGKPSESPGHCVKKFW